MGNSACPATDGIFDLPESAVSFPRHQAIIQCYFILPLPLFIRADYKIQSRWANTPHTALAAPHRNGTPVEPWPEISRSCTYLPLCHTSPCGPLDSGWSTE